MFCYGMPTLIELPSFLHHVRECRRLELAFIELNMNLPYCCPESLLASEVARIGRQEGLTFTLHLPEELDLASFHPSVRQAASSRVQEALVWAAAAEIEVATLHLPSGVHFTLPDRRVWVYEEYQDLFLSCLAESFEELYVCARACGVQLCVENLGDFDRPFIQAALLHLSEFPGFALTWDVGHNAACGFRDQRMLEEFNDRIAHIHLHDFDGARDHLPLWSGNADMVDALQFAQERELRVVIETKTLEAIEASLEALAARGW
ncbi:MAG: sugar phosphate isomerase/epimerase [Actinobacteria bacterium]|nr:sugar phosphate isomerase/epimerase [Actinomycetota bacterium]